MRHHLVPAVLSLLSLVFSVSAAAQDSSYTFTTIDVPGCTSASGINDDGHIVGAYDDAPGHRHGFLLAAGIFTTIDVPDDGISNDVCGLGASTSANGINNHGDVVGGYSDGGCPFGFLLPRGGTFSTIDVGGNVITQSAEGINNSGFIVGFFVRPAFGFYGFLLTTFFDTFQIPPGPVTQARGINDRGQIVGWYQDANQKSHGFLRSEDTFTTLDVPGSSSTSAYGINNHGQIVGDYTVSGDPNAAHGFLLQENAFTMIDVPDSSGTVVNGINNSSQIVGEYKDADQRWHCFFATPTPEQITVAVDIKPGSDANPINPRSNGKVPGAILTTNTFDATTVDAATVRLGATGAEAVPVRVAIEDVNHDGLSDLLLHFNTQDTGIECGATSASLTGQTFSGQPIRGADSIVTVGCKGQRGR